MQINLRTQIFLLSLIPLIMVFFAILPLVTPRETDRPLFIRMKEVLISELRKNTDPDTEKKYRDLLSHLIDRETFLDQVTRAEYLRFLVYVVGFLTLLLAYFLLMSSILHKPFAAMKQRLKALDKANYSIHSAKTNMREIMEIHTTLNLLCLELQRREDLLARQERLRGWQDMARVFTHEMRNLLTPVRIFIEEIISGSLDGLAEERKNLLLRSADGTLASLDIIQRFSRGLKDLSGITVGAFSVFSLSRLFANVRDGLSKMFPDAVIELKLPENLEMYGDPDSLFQAFFNLLKNALESCSKGSEAAGVSATETHNGDLIIEISDRGSGISPDKIKLIFEPQFSLKSNHMGIGLFYTRHILKEHQCSIEVRSVLGSGTDFILTFTKPERTHPDNPAFFNKKTNH